MHYLNKTANTTAMISVTLVIGAAAVLVLSLAENVQAQTIEEALRLLNAGADDLESLDPSAADRLRDVAALLGEGSICSSCPPLP